MQHSAVSVATPRFHTLGEVLTEAAARGIPTSRATLIRRLRERGGGRRFGNKILVTSAELEQLLAGEPLNDRASAA